MVAAKMALRYPLGVSYTGRTRKHGFDSGLLDRHGLLREIIRGDVWTLDPHDIKGFDEPFSAIT